MSLMILLIISIMVFLLSFAMIINAGGSAGLYSKISSQILAQRYSSISLLSLFISISSLILLFLTWRSDRYLFLIDIKTPLTGYITYVALVTLYFYDQIFNQSGFINILLSPAGIELPAGHLGLWSNSDLFTTRIIQTLISGILVYYGFFAAVLFSKSKNLLMKAKILFITMILLSLLFVINKLLGIKLHNIVPGTMLHMSLLFLTPFIFSLIMIKITEKNNNPFI